MRTIKTWRQIESRARHQRPTKLQREAFAKSLKRDGRKSLTQAECEALATHPLLLEVQRQEFAAMAESVNW